MLHLLQNTTQDNKTCLNILMFEPLMWHQLSASPAQGLLRTWVQMVQHNIHQHALSPIAYHYLPPHTHPTPPCLRFWRTSCPYPTPCTWNGQVKPFPHHSPPLHRPPSPSTQPHSTAHPAPVLSPPPTHPHTHTPGFKACANTTHNTHQWEVLQCVHSHLLCPHIVPLSGPLGGQGWKQRHLQHMT